MKTPKNEVVEREPTKITIVLKGEAQQDFDAMRRRLSPLAPDRFPATEVLAYCLRQTRVAEVG